MSELKTNLEQILQEKTTKLISENIKRKVEIFDVTGTDGDAEVEELQAKITKTRQEIADTRRDLENSAATVTGTGENVTLNQTAEATFKKLGIGGNSEQESTTGKNLFNLGETIRALNNIEITKNGSQLILNGTTIGNEIVCDIDIGTFPAGTYTITKTKVSGTYPDGTSNGVYIRNKLTTSNIVSLENVLNNDSKTFLLNEQTSLMLRVFVNVAGKTFNNLVLNFMLEEGSTATSYEPYTGGQASPNPDYPQEITNVTGDVEVVVENKNLLDTIEKQSYTQNGITVTNNRDGSFTLNGTNTNSSYIDLYITPNTNSQTIIKDLENGTYLLKIYELSGNINFNSTSCYVIAVGRGENNQFLNSMMQINLHNNKQYHVKSLEGCKLSTVKFYIGAGVTFNNYRFKIMMTKSSDTSLPYVEHKHQTFTFPLGNEKLMLGDYLADDGIHHKIQEDDLSTLTWASLGSNLYRSTAIDNIKIPVTTSTVPNILAEKYKARMQAGNFLNGEIAIMGAGNFAGDLLVCDETGTPSGLIQYELEEEVIVPYTEEQQQVYDEMKKVISYEGQTNVIGSSGGSNPIFTVTAFRDADLAIASLDNRVTLLED